jgi:uncharacterized protein (TIGR02145 family)
MKNYLLIFLSICVFNNLSAQLFGGQIKSNADLTSKYPAGSVFCASGPTAIVEVTNPTTGKIWMDRNLGASQVATSSTDAAAYGDLYQWGRRSDGHQCRTSATTTTLSSVDQPAHGNFIVTSTDWRNPANNNLWQGVNGINNPCPIGFRIPTETEWNNEKNSWSSCWILQNVIAVSNFPQCVNNQTLKLSLNGKRMAHLGTLEFVNSGGCYWSSNLNGLFGRWLFVSSQNVQLVDEDRGEGIAVRCIKN